MSVERTPAGIAILRIQRPERRNALDIALKNRIADLVEDLDREPGVAVIVITGTQEYFVAGTDLAEMRDLSPIEHTLSSTGRMFSVLRRCETPLIAAIEGYALGGGCELALSCDLIVAGVGAKIGQPEIRVGVIPGAGGTQRMVRTIGKYRALRLVLTGEPVSGSEAEAIGLISEAVPDGEALDHAIRLAEQIASMPPLAVQMILELIDIGPDVPLEAALMLERKAFQILFDSEDQVEGMTAFLEKRDPKYRGR